MMQDADSLSGDPALAGHTVARLAQASLSTTGHGNPTDTPDDDDYCWVCDGPVIKRHCKIVCPRCGFMRDCSDP